MHKDVFHLDLLDDVRCQLIGLKAALSQGPSFFDIQRWLGTLPSIWGQPTVVQHFDK